MEHQIDKKSLANELERIFNVIETQLDSINTLSTRQVARRLKIIGEQFIELSKEVRRKKFTEKMKKNE
jgi:hypothetical protein